MSPRLQDSKSLGSWLGLGPDATRGLFDRARRLAEMNQALRHWCGDNWTRQIRIANVRADIIVVFAASAAALVPLRSKQSDLLRYLNSTFGLSCIRIEAKVRPPAAPDQRTV